MEVLKPSLTLKAIRPAPNGYVYQKVPDGGQSRMVEPRPRRPGPGLALPSKSAYKIFQKQYVANLLPCANIPDMENQTIGPVHHQFTDKGYDYVAFEVRCGVCKMLLFEFVHQQKYSGSYKRLMAIPDSNPPVGAQSWYKPSVKVICTPASDGGDSFHGFIRVAEGEDRNQVVTSRQMNFEEFKKWMEGLP